MSLSIGIVGLPNVGKSTLFNALTKNQVLVANYPFATIEPNVGIVNVPDTRVDQLAQVSKSVKKIYTTVTFTDIAGLVKGAHQGAGLGNQFLAHIRECQAVAQVVRAFEDTDVVHVEGKVNPEKDIATIAIELCLADLTTVSRRLEKLRVEQKSNPKVTSDIETLEKLSTSLNQGKVLYKNFDQLPEAAKDLQLLTAKPFIYIFNVAEDDLGNDIKKNQLTKLVEPSPTIFLSAKVESELQDLNDNEAKELLKSLGQEGSGLDSLSKISYQALGLITFFTTGVKETRAWTIKKGVAAPEAAGVIHTDFQKGFIKAEVVSCEDVINAGGFNEAKAKGKVRLEGKDYVVRGGDVMIFKFNV